MEFRYRGLKGTLEHVEVTEKELDARLMQLQQQHPCVKVVTDRADELAEVLLRQMRHGVTVIPAEGMFSKQEKKLLVCIVNRHQIVQFQNVLCRFPGSFAYVSEVTETMGNFKHITH